MIFFFCTWSISLWSNSTQNSSSIGFLVKEPILPESNEMETILWIKIDWNQSSGTSMIEPSTHFNLQVCCGLKSTLRTTKV